MSRQFYILTTDIDLQALEKLLRDSGEVEFLSVDATADDRDLKPLETLPIPLAQAGKVPLSCYLVPGGLPRELILKRLSPVKVSVDDQRSLLINFMRPFYDGKIVRRGRLYYQNRILEGGSSAPKSPDFCRWADRIFTQVKKNLTFDRRQDAYLGNGRSNASPPVCSRRP